MECWLTTTLLFTADINAIAKMYGKQIIKNNEAYMTVEKMVVDFVMKGARFKVKDQGHQQLSKIFEMFFDTKSRQIFTDEVINQFLNQNAHELVQEMRQPASQSLAKVFKKFLDSAFVNLPMRLWLTD